jgi:hypothetical protein
MAYYPLKVKDSGGTVHVVGDPRIADKANTASPALTGTPTAPTATSNNNSTQIATTAYVDAEIIADRPYEATASNIAINGVQAVGVRNTVARGDHVHPTDTSRAPLASPTFTGTPAAPTAAADTNTTQVATTAYVVGQAGSATPVMDGTAAVGTSLRYARQDHVHASDTSRAPLASPALTGTPTAPTAAADTNTTQVATTAYVVGQAASTAPVMDGTAAVGTSARFARADHVHPTDTSRAPLYPTIDNKTASYTLVLADAEKIITMGSASAQTVTIPLNSSVAFPVGTKIDIVQTGAGECSVAPTAGVTLLSDTNKRKVNVQYAAVSCLKTGTDTWVLIGALKT